MKIAIIGAGAAGMTSAFLLNKKHNITIFEKASILGGNIRTLNKNLKAKNNNGFELNPNLVLDSGVIEFQSQNFPYFHKLMRALKIKVSQGQTSSELFLANGRYLKSGASILHHCPCLKERVYETIKILPLIKDHLLFLIKMARPTREQLYDKPVSTYLKNNIHDQWLKMLLMYAYSMPYNSIDDFPAEIAIPLLRKSNMFTKWDRIAGGVYSYIEKIVEQLDGKVFINANINSIRRTQTGVEVKTQTGENLFFDKIIFAVTPEQILKLLADPSEDEKRRFIAWKGNQIDSTIHTDVSFYKHFGVSYYSEFDVFQNDNNDSCGYNAYLNRLYKIDPLKFGHFSLAYNLNSRIDPKTIIHTQTHHTPLYTTQAIHYRNEIIATNGDNHTYHTGAYLGEGLHEGAIRSAFNVAQLFGHKINY